MEKINTALVQGYVLTTAKYKFNRFEKIILYRLVQIAQEKNVEKLAKHYTVNEDLFKQKLFNIKASYFVKPNDYKYLRTALKGLRNKTIEVNTKEYWAIIGLIEKPVFHKYNDTISFEVNPLIWDSILNFSKGFNRYDLNIAMQFKSVYTMRFYELFNNNFKPIIFSIKQLKEMFGIEDKYKFVNAFITKVIKPAQAELEQLAPVGFEFEPLKNGGRAIEAIRFYPFKNRVNSSTKQIKQDVSIHYQLTKFEIKTLKDNFGFTTKEIQNNINTFTSVEDLPMLLVTLKRKALDAQNPKGYIIASLKKHCKA